jgi:Ca-activated chloride channel family protein
MIVGGRVIDGVLDERGRARDTYDRAIAAGHRAAIAEEDRAGVFTLRVGNLMPGEQADIELGLVGPLSVEDGEVTFAFPLVVAPRYIPGVELGGEQAGLGTAGDTDRTPDASRITPPVLLPGHRNPVRLGFAMTVDGGGLPIGRLQAGLHELRAQADGAGWRVELHPGERLDRDVVLRWAIGGEHLRSSAVWAPDESGEGATMMVTMTPPIGAAAAARPRDVVFVLDRSGSMAGWKMVAARRAVARMIDTLTARDRFNVVLFDDRIDQPPGFHGLVDATDRRRFEAVEFLARVEARGGTELALPLEAASAHLRGGDDSRDAILVLITDGQVGNEDEILRRMAPRLGRARIFTLGIDQAVNAAFLRRLAAAGGGACELVESEDRLDAVMGKIHRRIATPIVTDVAIDAAWLDRGSQAPARLPSVFAGAPLVACLRSRQRPAPGAAIEVRGRLPGGTEYVERLVLDSGRPGTVLEPSWARARIRDLEDRYAAGGPQPALERAIVELSLRHRVLSRFTAFVAVDRSEVANRGAAPLSIVQPVEQPAGWSAGAVPPPPGAVYASMPSGAPAMPMQKAQTRGGFSVGTPAPAGGPPPKMRSLSIDDLDEEQEEAYGAGPQASFEELDVDDRAPADLSPPALRAVSPPSKAPAPQRAQATRGRAKSEVAREAAPTAPGIDLAPYQARLDALVDTLERALADGAEVARVRLPVERLGELLEDLDSIGASALARALAPIVDRLRRALAEPELAGALTAALADLRALRDGGPTSTPTPRKPSRWAFWK